MTDEVKIVPLTRAAGELSDAELQAERDRRRIAREQRGLVALPDPLGNGVEPRGRVARALETIERQRELATHFARLELKPGASLEDVERKHRELALKYDPKKFAKDPDKLRAATELTAELEKSYRTLLEALR
jgi:hypothetical protein